MALRTVGVKLTADVSQYVANMNRAGQSTKGFAQQLDKQAAEGKLDAIADRAGVAGIALGGAAAYAVSKFAEFDKQMSAVKAATHASTGEMDKLRAAAMQAGADTQYSATEAARGIEELAKAGISTADILGGGLKGALDLAAAGQIDVGEAAETAASALTQFKLKGKDVPHVADLLSAAAGKAQGSVADMSQALNQAGLIAAQTGLSIEDTTGTLAAFANAGLLGSDAGTSFKTMLQAVQAPSGKTKELMDDLGISAYDTAGNFIGITKFAGQLKEQLGKLTPELRANALAQIFGSDATRAASILYEQGSVGIQTWIDKTNDAGYAAETAAIKTDNLAGDIERLKGSIDTMLIQGGGGANGGLRAITQSLEAMVDQFGKLPSGVGATVVVLGGLSGALLLAAAGWVKARAAIAATVVELNAVGPAGARAAVALQSATKWAGRAAVAFIGLEVAGAVFDKLGNAEVNVTKLTAALQDYATTGKMTQGLTDEFGKNLDELALIAQSAEAATHGFWGGLNDLTSSIPGVSSAIDSVNESLHGTSFSDATERMKALDESFTAFIGTQENAKKAGELWNQILVKSGLDTAQLQALLPQASAALTELQKASHGGAQAQGALANSAGKTKEQLEQEAEAAEKLKKAFDDLFDQYMSADQAAVNYEKTLKATNKELKDGKKTLDAATEAGQENIAATLDLIDAVKDQRDANIENGMSVEKADAKYRKQISTLGATMEKLGFTRKEVERLIGKYRDVPSKVGTSIQQPGMPKSQKDAKEYKKQLDALAREIKTNVTVKGDAAAYAKLKKLLVAQQAASKGISVSAAQSAYNKQEAKAFHDGGYTGPGGKYEPAGTVHADEFVIKKESRRKIEARNPGLLDELNATGQLRGYAVGGRVLDMPFPVNASMTKVISMAEALSKVAPSFGNWPPSPSAQRGDSGVWRKVLQLIKSGPKMGSFGNAYRPGDPKWHGSGRAVDWMGYNMDPLAGYLASKRPLELIHRTNKRDYAYTRGVNKGSFNSALMNAHRNHIHIAMANGGTIREPVFGVGVSGNTYSLGEGYKPERVVPNWQASGGSGGAGGGVVNHITIAPQLTANMHPREVGRQIAEALTPYLTAGGKITVRGQTVLAAP